MLRIAPRHGSHTPSSFRWGATLRVGGILCCLLTLLAVAPGVARSAGYAEVWVDDNYHAGTPGWGVTRFASLANGLNAVEAGGVVHVNEGLYQGPFTLNKPGIHLVGEGQAANIILHGNGASYALAITANMVSLTGFKITGASLQGVRIVSCRQAHIVGCLIEGNGCVGLAIVGGQDHLIEDNSIASNQSAGQAVGIYITQQSANNRVQRNEVEHHQDTLQQGTGILIEEECTGTQVLSNTLAHNDFGLRVTECISSTIQGNHARSNLRSGIHIQDASATALSDNEATQNSGSGIMLVNQSMPANIGSGLAWVERNLCAENQAAGIYILGAPHVTLERNTCRANTLHGVALESSYITVTANSLVDNTLAGLRVYDEDPRTHNAITGIVAHGNTLLGNGTYELYSEMPETMNATGNWWGTNSPTSGMELAGMVNYAPYMELAIAVNPPAIAWGGQATQIRLHVGGGGYKVLNGTSLSLASSAGMVENPGPLLTVGGQAQTRLISGDIAQTAILTATTAQEIVTTTVRFFDPAGQEAALAITLDGGPDPVCAGYNLAYQIICTNTGTLELHNVAVTTLLPEGTSPLLEQSSPGAVYDEPTRTVRWTLGALSASAGTTLHLSVHTFTVLEAGDVLTMEAQVAADEAVPSQAEKTVGVIACATPTPSVTPTPTDEPEETITPTPTPTETPGADELASITGQVWVDVNHNDSRDEGEPPLEGVRLELSRNPGPQNVEPLAIIETEADGRYLFEHLPAGEYCMVQLPPEGYQPSPANWCGFIAQGATQNIDWAVEPGYALVLPCIQQEGR